MQHLSIQRIKLTNFKGCRSFETKFQGHETFIYGRNRSGKTTVIDAAMWLLFGKNSNDQKDFGIKTLDESGSVIPEIDHEVEADFKVGNQVITLRRCLRENWVKRRGSATTEFAGNETLFFWNDVPLKAGEYQEKVNALVDEKLSRLLTDHLS